VDIPPLTTDVSRYCGIFHVWFVRIFETWSGHSTVNYWCLPLLWNIPHARRRLHFLFREIKQRINKI